MTDPLMRAAQALTILNALERHTIVGGRVEIVRTEHESLPWVARYYSPAGDQPTMTRGESVSDALGQLTTVLTLEAG